MKESREKKTGKGCRGFSSSEDGVNREDSRGVPFKKGPWTPAEDAILVDFVVKNGEGNWNAVHKLSGLRRCGKSCRLRWANHLRPDLKKGAFTSEEECLIIELHARMGNKWARMAAQLPGRTDNEIKNFWNTRTKRLQRTGMPIYPIDICLKVFHENRDGENINLLQTTEMLCPNAIQTESLNMPEVEFKDLKFNQGLQFFPQLYPPPSSMTKHSIIPSQSYYYNLPRMHLPGHLQESQTFSGLDYSLNNHFPLLSQQANNVLVKQDWPYESSFPSATGRKANNELLIGMSPCSHAFSDAISSSSLPIDGAIKRELPSFQYSDTQYHWGTPVSPLPSFGSADTLIQTSLTEHTPSNCVSPRSSGLLEAVVYESQTLKCTEKIHSQTNKDTPILHSDTVKSKSLNSCEIEWDGHGNLYSPLANSPVSGISDCTPGTKISSEN